MRAADTSLVVAAFASWHEFHQPARDIVDQGVRLVDHCVLETYSVLTRLPPPHRCPAGIVRNFLKARFPLPWLRLDAESFRNFVLQLPEHEVSGGGTYDALVAATAAKARAELVTCDRRAATLYESYGVRAVFVG